MGKFSISLHVCVLLVLSVLWKPALSDDKCSAGCIGNPTTPTFLDGNKYNYGVEGVVTIFLTGAEKQETSVKLLGQVSVSALGNCAHILKVQNLVISGPDGKKYNKPNGLEKPVRFTLQDGRVGPELCAEEGDTRRSLNIKRAIISMLQTELKSSTQVDVFGSCPTDSSSSQEGGAVLVHRSRDLSRCAHREQTRSGLVSAVFNPTAEIKNSQVLQSSLNVESKVNNGVPEKVSAIEEYLYRPFSVGENGARAKVHTKLTLTGKAGGADAGKFTEPRTIVFENPHGKKTESSNFQSAQSIIKETAKTLGSEASSKSAGIFAQAVRILQATSKDDLIKVFNQCKASSLEKRVFLDALLRAGSGPAIEASIQILKSKELSELENNLVFLSLGNAKHVNDDALKAAASLLDLPKLPKETYLGVGALAGAYCREHFCHDGKSAGIAAISQKFIAKLHNCKPKTKVDEDYVVAALKGIRNIRHLEDGLVDKLVACANDNGVKARVRVAALEAFHADPCSAKIHKTAQDLMKNRQLDSEIRIKAYLALIECPCAKSATEIKNLLETEPVHQVGRFISSSLRHIRASANPDKALARQHYGLIRVPNKFNIDDRKYSFYREVSYNVDALGLGGNLEQSVIYSQDNFLPRSVSLNLTTEIFGHNLNIFEVGGRQGNLDRVIEHFLGPQGLFRSQKPQDIYDNILKRYHEAEAKVKSRGRRSVKTEIDNFDKHVKAEAEPYNNELDLDIYVKLFGTDAVFLSLGDDKGFDFNSFLDKMLENVDGSMNKVKHFQQEIRTHLLFLDAELAYPTSTGLPLKLDLIGAATGRFDISTNVDVRQIMKDPNNAKVDIKLVPSTDIEITGLFFVDADAVATGLKVTTNLHSSTGGHLIAKVLENGRGFDLQFGLPIDKQEILTASNDLVYVTAEKGQKAKFVPIKIDTQNTDYTGCFDQLAKMIGLTLCGEVSVPFSFSGPEAQTSISKVLARYPLTGPSKVKLVLEKNDLRGYHVKGVVRGDSNNEKRSFELLFEAEGSKNRRTQLNGELINSKDEKTIKLDLQSPIKTLSGQVSLLTKPSEYTAFVKGKIDKAEYYGKVGFTVQGDEKRSVFKPIAEFQLPEHEKQSLKVDGQLIREINGPSTKYSLDGIKINMPNSNEIVDIDGFYHQEPKGRDIDIKAKKGEHNLHLVGSLKGHDAKMEFTNSLNPYVNFKVDGHIEFGETIHNDLDVVYGGDLKNSKNRVVFNQLLKYHGKSSKDFSVITKNKFEIHVLPLKLKFDAKADPKKLEIEVKGQYVDKKGEFDLDARTHIKKPGDYSVKMTASSGDNGVEALAKRDIVSAEKSNFENYIAIKNLARYELSGVVMHKTKPNDVNVGAVGYLKISGGGKNEDVKFDIGGIENTDMYSSHAKISSSQGELLDYLLKINRGANPNGQLKFVLKETVSANGQFKVTDNDGKGNGMLIIDFKKSQRKIKGDVKFTVKEPIYKADVDVFLNFEKDNNDKIHFSTNTESTKKSVNSKNKLEYAGKNTELNVKTDGVAALTGKTHANIEVVLPTQRCLTLKFDRDFTEKSDVYNGNVELLLSDAEKRGAAASTINYKAKVVNTNLDKLAMDYEGQVELKLKNGKHLTNTFVLKNVPQGENGKFDFKSDVKGDLIPKPASLSASMEYTGIESIDGTENYRVKGAYGDDISFELIGKDELKVQDKGEKKYLDDYTLSFRLPLEKGHDIKLVSTTLFIIPENKNTYLEYTIVESVSIDSDVYKVDASGKAGPKDGFGKVKILVPHVDPVSLNVNYKADLESEKRTGAVDIKATYGKGKTAAFILDSNASANEYTIEVKGQLPENEKLKKLDVKLHAKNPSPSTYTSSLIVDADGRVYKTDTQVVLSKVQPMIDVKYTSPSTEKPARIYAKGNSVGSNNGKLEVKLENIRDMSLEATAEGNIQKDQVVLKASANSDKLGLKNSQLDISSKDAGSGKRLEIHATNDNKNVLSGSTSFISKQEGYKTIIEGSGSVKVYEDQKSANFKYIRTLLTEGNEQGVETFLNLAVGDRSYVAESRITNMEYKNSIVYCEEKKQCAHAELHSKINVQKSGYQHQLNVGLDLRKLGLAPEFGLQIAEEVSDKKLPQYSLDLHINKEDKKYHMHVYSQPESGKFPAGITITLPQRVLALESLLSYPTDKTLPFPIKGEIALHMDKNKPQHKSAARFLVDVTGSDKQHSAVAEFGFSHPKLGKEALIKVHGNIQRPNDKTFKIETASSISHPSLGKGDHESKVLLEVNPEQFKLLVDTPLVKVIDIKGDVVMKDNLQQAGVEFSLLEGKPVTVKAIVKDFTYYEFTTGYSDDATRKLSIIGHLDPEKRVDVSADIILPGEKKNIIHGALFLQDNLIKSDYGVSKENFKYFVNALKNDLTTLEGRIRKLGEKASSDFKTTLKKVEPTYKKLEQAYRDDLDKLVQEVSSYKELELVARLVKDVIQFTARIITDVTEVTGPIIAKIQKTISETCHKIGEMYEKNLEPQLKELYGNVAAILKEYLEGLIDLVAHFAALVSDFFEKHKAEIQELTNTFAEIFKDLTRLIVGQLKEYRGKVAQIFADLTKQIKELPMISFIKEKFEELAVPEQIIHILTQIHDALKQLLPTEEIKAFADALFQYVQKKLHQEKCDDAAELRVVYEKLTVAITSLLQLIRTQLNQLGVPALINVNPFVFFSGPGHTSMPSLGGPPSFSILNQIIRGDVPDPIALINAYRPRSLNPLDEIPAKLRAVVVNGQHIFTFDGRHLTFPGTCRYVLAHDFVDRNFTLVMQLQNGKPKSLALEHKDGKVIELKENGQVTVNGAAHGFPVMGEDVYAFREPNGRIGIGSLYGIMVFCTSKIETCYIEVSGFYLGKLRGLLGDGNNEPFDDFRLPNGKIATNEAEFGNAYKLSSGCAAVKTPEHSHSQHHAALPPACELVFGGTSPLRPLALFLDMAPFRQACIHATTGAADPQAEACELARGYTALALTGALPAVLPPVCLKCTDADTPRAVGDTYEVKAPAHQADVIVVIETTKSNEQNYKNLAVPLVSQLIDNLKSKQIKDIKVYLVGVTSKFPYPIIYDTDLKLKSPKPEFVDESRYQYTPRIITDCEKINKAEEVVADFIDNLRIKLGLTNIVAGYDTIMQLPLRAGAAKHIISVVGEHCKSQLFIIEALRALAYSAVTKQNILATTLITVMPDLTIGAGKEPSQVVGFTKNGVLMLGDKKFNKDSEAIRNTLTVPLEDGCVFFNEAIDGLVLSATNFHGLNPGQQKQYLQTAANAISSHMLQETLVQQCTCGYVDAFRVKSICYPKERKEVARRRK